MLKMGKTVLLLWIGCLPGLLSATCSSSHSPDGTSSFQTTSSSRTSHLNCFNGWCSEDGTCSCNPCWSGSTCHEYVDRFGPRFLAEEPFFVVSVGSERVGEWEVPLFRIESADDDLGLTCQLGQVGPAATCPCATPRYTVLPPSQAVFRADHETGDVFIKPGFSLLPGKHYFITLQVSGMEVNGSGSNPWKEVVTATLYVKASESEGELLHSLSESLSASNPNSDSESNSNSNSNSDSPSPSTLNYNSVAQGRQSQPSLYLSRSKRLARYSRKEHESGNRNKNKTKTRDAVDASRVSPETILQHSQQNERSRHIH